MTWENSWTEKHITFCNFPLKSCSFDSLVLYVSLSFCFNTSDPNHQLINTDSSTKLHTDIHTPFIRIKRISPFDKSFPPSPLLFSALWLKYMGKANSMTIYGGSSGTRSGYTLERMSVHHKNTCLFVPRRNNQLTGEMNRQNRGDLKGNKDGFYGTPHRQWIEPGALKLWGSNTSCCATLCVS